MLLVDAVRAVALVGLEGLDAESGLLHRAGHEAADCVFLPAHLVHDLLQGRAVLALEHGDHLGGLAALAGTLSLGLRGPLGDFGGFLARGRLLGLGGRVSLGLAALGAFLAFGRGLLGAGTLLQGGLLRRNVRALCRNGGGVFGGFCVLGGHFRLISFCGTTAVTTWITPVPPESKWILLDLAKEMEWRCGAHKLARAGRHAQRRLELGAWRRREGPSHERPLSKMQENRRHTESVG